MNTKVGKRKNIVTEVKIEPPKKALKKNELLVEYNALKKRFDSLIDENKILLEDQKKKEEAIKNLEETVDLMKNEIDTIKKDNKATINVSVQTEQLRCEECDFAAEEIYDLVDHMQREHPLEDYEFDWRCEHCGKGFFEQPELIFHIKYAHEENIKHCKHFLEGRCVFGNHCRFSHEKNREIEKIKCMFCDESFDSKSQLMIHRKNVHPKRVKECKNSKNGSCQHGPVFCWYHHTKIVEVEHDENDIKDNKETDVIIKKLVDMVESFGHRLMVIENK